jgi:hypothetical protein
MTRNFAPGDFVRHPTEASWGLGQVQSVVGNRVTVSFENRGKELINVAVIPLVAVTLDSIEGAFKD